MAAARRATRSKKLKPRADEEEEEDVPNSQFKRSKVAGSSDDPGSVVLQLQPPHLEASAVETHNGTSRND